MRKLFILGVLLAAAPAAAQDIPWFEANPSERQAVLRRCHDDHRIARTATCANAETAETRAYARRLGRSLRYPDPPSPMVIEAAKRACARPPSERGLLGSYCNRI